MSIENAKPEEQKTDDDSWPGWDEYVKEENEEKKIGSDYILKKGYAVKSSFKAPPLNEDGSYASVKDDLGTNGEHTPDGN